jgi:hypothetical protein
MRLIGKLGHSRFQTRPLGSKQTSTAYVVLAEIGHSLGQSRPLTVMSRGTTIGAIKLTAEIAHRESKAARGKLDSNVLVSAVVIGGAGWACLRKDRAASRSAVGAAQAFCPLVALVHYRSMPLCVPKTLSELMT